ncbi:enoyl-CoA hydratase/isomerase family protein [Pseudohoeflea coraliihabitans]|uniref:Enoyl-CoA hydratase/isomerase family protein n=1 Tax=Pseudohoeflea coraliihabitans TaxID=2860393 RepID=A0ABS6WIS0_9HYPH|nr:enoyl-CoA hydratase/isomerase family protein [Pseudohoeflea sp. DP4N28-3]MBW3095816.1 enoyl-CoA hydratase/isomerase family protein [Pseudohoeflea sp. DP4N28-3]
MTATLYQSDGAIRRVTLNRPDKLNALTIAMLTELKDAIDTANADPQARAIVLTGAGRAFCAGADRTALATLRDEAHIRGHAMAMHDAFLSIRKSRLPVVAGVQGYALGAGCGLVTVAHLAVAAEDAVFGYPEIGQGIMPALVAPGLVDRVGTRRAYGLLATARRLDAAAAFAMGLVADTTSKDADAAASELAQRLAKDPEHLLADIARLTTRCVEVDFEIAMSEAAEQNIRARLARLNASQA